MATSIRVLNPKSTFLIDEPEQVSRSKIKNILTYVYANLCQKLVLEDFQCEGCEKEWPSQRDHLCCILSDFEIFNFHLDEVKNKVDIDFLFGLCSLMEDISSIPPCNDLSEWINQLKETSANSICSTCRSMERVCDDEERVVELVHKWCEQYEDTKSLELEMSDLSWLKHYLGH